MPALKLEQFGGQLPAWDEHLLPVGQAAESTNTYLFSGALEGWREPALLRPLTNPNAKFAYRIPVISESQANAYLVMVANVQEGDTVTVSDITYTFTATVKNANDVLLATNPTGSLINLLHALTYDFGEGTNVGVEYGVGTLANSDVLSYSPDKVPQPGLPSPQVGFVAIGETIYPYLEIGSVDFGAAFNSIGVSESTNNARSTWLADLLSLNDRATTYTGGTNASFVNDITGDATWLEFLDQDTNVVKSQVVDDFYNRYYFASPNQIPEYNTYNRIKTGKPAWKLGVPPPGCAPVVGVTAGGNTAQYGNTSTNSTGAGVALNGNSIYLIPFTPNSTMQLSDVTISGDLPVSPGPYQGFEPLAGFRPINYFGYLPAGVTTGPQSNGDYISLIATPGKYGAGSNNSSITVNPDGSLGSYDGTPFWTGILYSDNNGAPGDLIASGEFITGMNYGPGVENTAPFVNAPTVTGGQKYWIGIIAANPMTVPAVTTGANALYLSNTFANGPPAIMPAIGSFETVAAISIIASTTSSTDVVEARSYVYTYVTAYNEEGPPSPPTLANGWSNGNWNVQVFSPPPRDMGIDRNIAVARLYRTVVGVSGSTVFFWVADLSLNSQDPDAQAFYANNPPTAALFSGGVQSTLSEGIQPYSGSYADNNPDNLVALTNQLASTNWFPPPENLEALITMPNGMMAGFKDNEIWFCEPYLPHAWPPGYVLTTDFPIVGLGLAGPALVAATGANAYVSNGVSPGNMTLIKSSQPEPCISKASVLSGDNVCTYMSPNGLIQVGQIGQVINVTDLWVTREKWQQKTPQKFPRAIMLASCYFCYGSTSPATVVPADNSEAQQGFTIELDQDNASFTIWPQPGGHRLGYNDLTAPRAVNIDNILTDPWTGIGMTIQGGSLYYFNFADPEPTIQVYDWKSKVYQQNTKKSYAAMKVFFTVPPGTPSNLTVPRVEAEPTDPVWDALSSTQYAIIKTYADPATEDQPTGEMVLVDVREIRKSGELLRLPSGFKAETWQWEIIGRVKISNVQIATSAKELANV